MSEQAPRKILALSMLRLGDVALCAPALRSLRDAYSGAQITLVLNRSCLGIAPLLPYVDHFVAFDRDELQRGLVDAHRPLFEPYESFKHFVDGLAAERYDLAVNFTHTKLSGCIAGLAGAARTIGLSIDEAGRVALGSRWFGVLDDQAGRFDADAFHYSDVFRFAIGAERCSPSLHESVRGDREANAALEEFEGREILAVQAFTSDEKKNWNIDRFTDAIVHVAKSRGERAPALAVALLGAEFERARLEPLERGLRAAGVDARLTIASIEGLFSIITRATLTLTGDTVAMHFAAAAGTPCVALAMGSSDWRRTGPYADDCYIVQARELCAPCPHSRDCPLPHRTCADRITSASVAEIVIAVLDGDEPAIVHAARTHGGDVDLLRSRLGLVWSARDVTEEPRADLEGMTARLAWKLRIDGADDKSCAVTSYGAATASLAKAARARSANIDWRAIFLERESRARALLAIAQGKSQSLSAKTLTLLRDALSEDPASLALARVAEASLQTIKTATEFVATRSIQSAHQEISARLEIEARIARGAANEFARAKPNALHNSNLFNQGASL